MSGKAFSASISTLVTSPLTVIVVRSFPASQTETGISRFSTFPSAWVMVSRAGIGTSPLSRIITSNSVPFGVTLPIAWSSCQVSKYQLRQNQERSCPLAVLKALK